MSSITRTKPFVRYLTQRALLTPIAKKILERIPGIRKIYPPVQRTHPFDIFYRVDTSGLVSEKDISSDQDMVPLINPYIGSQPSIIRQAIQALGRVDEYTFIDLGCGKGRAALVASEFPFRDVIGVELSPVLAATARKNAAGVALRFPERPRITILTNNVLEFPLPPGKLVFFNYNAFGPEIHARMLAMLEQAIAGDTPHVFFIHYNPVQGYQFDASPRFSRYFAKQIGYDLSEIGFGPDADDAVVIWQSVRGTLPTPHGPCDCKIIEIKPSMRVGLETS